MWVALRAEIDWVKHTWCIQTLCGGWEFLWGNGSNPHKKPTTQPFSFIFVAFYHFCEYIPYSIFQIGAVGDLV
jgi:hypothetical protein